MRISGESDRFRIWSALEGVWQDASYAARNFAREPGFTLLALIALGGAIGVNTSLFTVFNAVALRPWNVKDPGRVVNVLSMALNSGGERTGGGFSLAEYRYFSEHARSFDSLIAMRAADEIRFDDSDRRLPANYVTGNYFQTLGVDMEKGRGFLAEEDRMEAPQAVGVLSYRAWQSQFGGDPAILDRRVRLDGVPFTIVGVASRDFGGTSPARNDIWLPFSAMALLHPGDANVRALFRSPKYCCSSVAARLAPGAVSAQARAELETLSRQFSSLNQLANKGILLAGTSLLANPGAKRNRIVPAFALMFFAVTVVLLLACANVGNLLLARAAARKREVAIRLALGAGRSRLFRQFITESSLLACAASAVGVLIAWVLPSYIMDRALDQAASFYLRPDLTVLLYAVFVAVLSCLAFGLVPSLHVTHWAVAGALREHAGFSGVRLSLRNVLLSIQVAASIVLLVGAGLLVRGLARARNQDPGFAVAGVAIVSFELPSNTYQGARRQSFFLALQQELERAETSQQVGFASLAPLSPTKNQAGCRSGREEERQVLVLDVSAGYFDVLRIPIATGRNFGRPESAPNSIIVNQTLASRYWPGESPIGKSLICAGAQREVVGVAKDAYTWGFDQIEPAFYQSYTGASVPEILTRRTQGDGAQAIASVVNRLDARIKLRVTPLSGNLDRWLAPSQVIAMLAGVLGTLALALATIGMFGVFAYVVQQRTQELGIRMALGAQPAQVVRLVLGATLRAVLAGLGVGFTCALGVSRLLARFLYGVSPLDPLAYCSVAVVFLLAATAASYLPARRATRVDPMTALRYQ